MNSCAGSQPQKKILVVDDEQDILDFITEVLDKHYEVHQAVDSNKAFDKLNKHEIDLVLLDLGMLMGTKKQDEKDLLLDGIPILKRIKSDEKTEKIPVIVITCFGTWAQKEAMEAGANDYVAKPFHIDLLLAKIASLIARFPRNLY